MPHQFSFGNVSKTYGNGTKALDQFSFEASKGERVSLLGPSGCGKSTVLRLLAGLDQADNPNRVSVSQLDAATIGYVFQDATLLPWKNVWDNVYLPLRLARISRTEAKTEIDKLIERVGLSEFAHAKPAELSGGMKMRVSIARALITKPDLLLLDEPFAALDEMTRFDLNDLILDLHANNDFTLVLVTHSVFEAVYLSERVAIMSNRPGRILHEEKLTRTNKAAGDYRISKQYQTACARVSSLLQTTVFA